MHVRLCVAPLKLCAFCIRLTLLPTGKNDRLQEAQAVYDEMRAASIEPNVHVFTALIGAFRRHRPEHAIELFQELKAAALSNAQLQPTAVTYSVVIEAAGRLRDAALVDEYFRVRLLSPLFTFIYLFQL